MEENKRSLFDKGEGVMNMKKWEDTDFWFRGEPFSFFCVE